jgi:hypothetical protein
MVLLFGKEKLIEYMEYFDGYSKDEKLESFKKLVDWIITNKRSVFIESDISLEDKKRICYELNISTDVLDY